MVVTGCGKVAFGAASTFEGGLQVMDNATVALNDGSSPGKGAVTLAGTATLEVAQSGTATLGNKLALEDGATLAFTFTEKGKGAAPVLAGTSVEVAGETVSLRVATAGDMQPRGGTYVLTIGMDFTGKTVRCSDPPKWVIPFLSWTATSFSR